LFSTGIVTSSMSRVSSIETLRLFGEGHAVTVVRAALFNAAIAWSPLQLDALG
jgi:hypothetical protein